MLIYYLCEKACNHNKNSFEVKLAKSLIKKNFSLWSSSITLTLGEKSASYDIDDALGNTSIAIVVLSRNFLEEKESLSMLQVAMRYDTIRFVFVLNDLSLINLKSNDNEFINSIALKLENSPTFASTQGLTNISSEIGVIISKNTEETNRVSTGIVALDYLLGGGLMLGSSFNIIGPRGSGKTSLGIQIQKHILESGGGCLYITYSEAPIKILRRFNDMNCDITKYIRSGRFRIFDSFSVFNNLSEDQTRRSVGSEWFSSIIRVNEPYNAMKYFDKQIEALEQIGPHSVNVIDSVNKRFEISKKQADENESTYKEHFSRFKAMAGDVMQNIGIHLVTADYDNDELIQHLTRAEDGTISLRHLKDATTGEVIKQLRIDEKGQIGCGDHNWYEYSMSQNGIKIFRPNFET